MKIQKSFRVMLLCFSILLSNTTANYAQMTKLSFGNAFNMLNSGSKYSASTMQGSSVLTSVLSQSYTKKVSISYGIPISILFEYIAVKLNLSNDIACNPDNYNNSPGNVQSAFDNLTNSDFVRISDYKKINVKLNFRFNPAQLVDYGSIEEDYLNNTQSSPWDAKIYKMPNTPVSASKIMVIQK
jgi:hypothetical protein